MKKYLPCLRGWKVAFITFLFALNIAVAGSCPAGAAEGTAGGTLCSTRSLVDLTACIRQHRLSTEVDYRQIFASGTQLLIVAEGHHLAGAHHRELAGATARLKAAGVTHLVLEAMPSSRQHLLGKFKQGTLSVDRLAREILNFSGWESTSYALLIEAALKAGIDVAFMDSEDDRGGIDLYAPNWKQFVAEATQRRDAHWLQVVQAILRSSENARLVVLVGVGHVEAGGYPPPLQNQLAAMGRRAQVITLEGGEVFFCSAVTEAARIAGLQNERFVVATRPSDSPTGSIYHIHLPQGRQVKGSDCSSLSGQGEQR
jgi:hypothetical protein